MENGGLDYMTSNEELQAADAAKAAINALLTATPKSAIVATLRKANTAAILNFSGQRAAVALNEARKNVRNCSLRSIPRPTEATEDR